MSPTQRRAFGYAATGLVAMAGVLADRPPWRIDEWAQIALPDGGLFVAFAVGAGVLAGLLWTLALGEMTDARWIPRNTRSIDADATGRGPLGVVFVLLAAVTEELLFRGAAFSLLASAMPALLAALLSSVAFALLHDPGEIAPWRSWALFAAFGLFQSALVWTFGSLVGAIACHAVVNVLASMRISARDRFTA